MVSPGVKKISFQFMTVYDNDVGYLEKFSKETSYFKNQDFFSELRQTINFLLLENFDQFFDPLIRSKRFGKLKSSTLIVLLEKFKSDISYFSKASAADKARTKMIESFITQLKKQN